MPSVSAALIVMAMLVQLVISPYASAATAPAQGDLTVYSVGYHSSSAQAPGPALFLLLDPALYVGTNRTQHLQYLQQALVYLMDTPGLMADNLQLGIGKVAGLEQGETATEMVLVPVAALGQVDDSHKPESQRYKIKNFIKDQCPQFPSCGRQHTVDDGLFINSMAAYAQASAYMMGTDTYSSVVNKAGMVSPSSAAEAISLNDIEIIDIRNTSSQSPAEQPSLKASSESVVLMDIEPVVSINNTQKLYSKPIYNQCSARYFETKELDALTYSVGNAVVIITAESDSAALISSGSVGAISTLNPLAMMTQSLMTRQPSSTRDDLDYHQRILQQCRSQLLSSTSNPSVALSPNINQTLGIKGVQPGKALSWRCVQDYARHLNQFKAANNDYRNPLGIALKTAVIAFSNAGNALNVVGENKGLPSYDCLTATVAPSIRNKCLLGQYGHNYGEGGFFQSVNARVDATSEQGRKQSVELAQALTIMAKNLTTQPSAMARMPPFQLANFMHSNELFTESYQTYLQPQFGSLQAQWPGGVSKYQSSVVNDIFASRDINSKSKLLKNPRNIYLSQAETGGLIAQTTESINRFQLPKLTQKQQLKLRQSLLSYMFDTRPPSGGIHHSMPIALISKAQPLTSNQSSTINSSESTKYSYKKHILYGAMDNALHIIDEATGEEVAAYFAKEVLAENGQYQAIRQGSLAALTEAHPSFGIDGPWTQYARYVTNAEGESIAKPLYVFGGARLGARAYYGLDLTGLDKVDSARNLNGFSPKQLFTITPERQDFGQLYFKQLGYSWSKPVITHINWFGVPKLVAILSGGYDATEYDKPDGLRERYYLQQGSQSILGNAIYIVDAKTGVPLIVATAGNEAQSIISSKDDNGFFDLSKGAGKVLQVANPSMLYSITGSVKAMDREEDGLTDHLYFADLEGQLFRLDIDNVASSPTLANKVRVVRLADFRRQKNSLGPRFYETPVVTLQNHNAVNSRSSKFATVSVASGDRSHPLRITDPTKHTVSLEIEYLDSLGHRQLLQAIHKQFLTDDAGIKLGSSDWQLIASDSALTKGINSNSDIRFDNGQFQLATKLFKPGSLLKATTTFASTDKVSASLRTLELFVSSSPNQTLSAITDPLAPILSVTKDWIGIKPMTTEKMSALSRTANYVYTLYDKDVANPALFNTPISALQTRDIYLTEENFPDLTTIDVNNSQLTGYQKQGWRSPLTQFGQHHTNSNKASVVERLNNQNRVLGSNSSANAFAIKAFGPMFAVSNKLYLTAYNPVSKSQPLATCRAQLIGDTEVYQFCLPYGNCNTANKAYRSHVQRIGYGSGFNPLSWKTAAEGKTRQLFTSQASDAYPEANPTEETYLSLPINLNDSQLAPKFVNSFTLQPQLHLEQWFDYSNHLAISD